MKRLLTTSIALAVMVVGFAVSVKPVEAATIPLEGHAWSENIGWIKFRNPGLYGVTVNTATGNFSGYAWSEHMGWLSFTSTDTASCGPNANLNTQSGVVTGWAKFLTNGECVKMNPPSGVTYSSNTSEFSGYAWGGDVTGWIKWKKTGNPNYVVRSTSPILAPPTAPNNLTATPVSKTQINLAWNNTEQGTKVRIERSINNNSAFSQIYEAGNANVTTYNDTGLTAGTLYYYRVKAFNNNSDESPYSNTVSTTTLPLTATISVNVTPNNASWTITNNRDLTSVTRTGDTSVTVNPHVQGTTYTITPGNPPSGYDPNPTVTNSTTITGSAVTLFDENSTSFIVTYQESIVFDLGGTDPGSGGGGGGGESGTENPDDVTVQKGGVDQYGTTEVRKTLISGPTRPVYINVFGLPSGVDVQYDGNRDCSPSCETTLTLVVSPSAPVGNHTITVRATPQGYTQSQDTNFNLRILAAVELFVACQASPSPAQVGQTVTWTATPSLGTAPYTFEFWSGDVPEGAGTTVNPTSGTYSTTGSKAALGKFRDSKGVTATCPANSVNIGVDPSFQEF